MVLFLPILNRVSKITTATFNAIRIIEMSSRKSPYFTSKEEFNTAKAASSPSKRQTRSSKQQTIKIKFDDTSAGSESANEKVKSKKAKKVVSSVEENTAQKHFLPENWEAVLNNIQIMRAEKDAPVDQMGAEQCADSATSPEV
jgi:endonuclease-3